MGTATTSTIPAVIDALLEKFTTQSYAYRGQALQVKVFDGFPGPRQPPILVAVGGAVEPTQDGEQTWAGLGARVRYEDYEVSCYVSAAVGGDGAQGVNPSDPAASSDAQRTARGQAFAVLATIENALRNDWELSSVTTPPGIMWCEIGKVGLQQTTLENATTGRIAAVRFAVHVKARLPFTT